MDSEALQKLKEFTENGNWKYRTTGPNATEPAAFAALALCAHDLVAEAEPIANWLADIQTAHGSVGVTEDQQTPAWPTSLAILTWRACDQATGTDRFAARITRALDWTLKTKGKTAPNNVQVGHDTSLVGWSWAENTHSWLEPTCLFVLALNAVGKSNHPRTREGVRIIVDRLLDRGGCNYGNTRVLGQATLPHVQPTGLAMLAIAAAQPSDPRIGRSLDYLADSLKHDTSTASLCFALMGLAAHDRRPHDAESLLANAFRRDEAHQSVSCYKLALLNLAGFDHLRWLPRSKSFATLHALK